MSQKTAVKKAAKKKKVETDITSELYVVDKPEELKIREFKWTEKQIELISLITDRKTKIVFLAGPAGTSKSLVSVFAGLKLLQEKKINEIVYIRSAVESSSKSIGFLPGDLDQKLTNYSFPLLEKCDQLLPKSQVDGLLAAQVLKPISNQFLRGIQWNNFVIIDEAQNYEEFELTTILTRLAEGGTMIFAGDPHQSDIKGKSGFMKMFNLFNNEESKEKGIHTFNFTNEDIMRSKILKFICAKLDTLK